MDPQEIVRLWDTTRELCRDTERDAALRRQALRQFFAALTGPDEEMDAALGVLQSTLELLRD